MENDNINNNIPQTPPQVANTMPIVDQPQVVPNPMLETPTTKPGILSPFKEVVGKIKANKKLSILLITLISLLILIIITGSIYSLVKNSRKDNTVSVSPTPQPTAEIMVSEESRKSESKLKELKNEILNLDIEQRHLTPPTIDFDISF